MQSVLNPPLRPRNGRTLEVLGIARISGLNQDELSLDDQAALYRRWLDRHYGKPFHLRMVAGRGKGEVLDRREAAEAQEAVETGRYDLVITEDLGRIFRRIHAYLFCETCEDHTTRLIAINDHVDTAGNWRLAAIFAVLRHESYNQDTSERIKRTLRNRFQQGGVFQIPIYGYIKPPGAKGDTDVRKDPRAEPVYDEWFRRLEAGATYAEVADWLNDTAVKPGPYSRSPAWTGRMVRQVTFNPILKGVRQRNRKTTVRHNASGERRSVPAPPEDLLSRECPHLAFVEPKRYDRLIRQLRGRNGRYTRGRGGPDRRKGVSRKRTAWPGQHVRCGVCGRLYYWGGHGQTERMMCAGCRDYRCWNAVTFDGVEAGQRLGEAILAEVEGLPDFDPAFAGRVRAKAEARRGDRDRGLAAVSAALEAVGKQLGRVTGAIAEAGMSPALKEKLASLEADRERLLERRDALERQPAPDVALPTMAEIRRLARDALGALAAGSPEFGRLMRELVPHLAVYPYRLIDDGRPVLRAKLTLNLAALVPPAGRVEGLEEVLRRELTVDLFDRPQRVEFRERVVRLRAGGRTERQVAAELGITVTAAQRAAALQRLMDGRGLTDPYEAVTEPPAACGQMRRHRHKRYKFEPLEGGGEAA
jgi:DNA invertase Pin-like site-specific DNA recombinase